MGDRRLKDSSSVVEFLFRPSRPPWEITSSCLAWLPLKKAELNYLASIQSVTKGQSAGWKNRSRSLDTVFLLLIFGQNLGFFRTSWHLPFPIFLVKKVSCRVSQFWLSICKFILSLNFRAKIEDCTLCKSTSRVHLGNWSCMLQVRIFG